MPEHTLPTNESVLGYYFEQSTRHKTPKGFARGSVERAAYIDWYVSQIPHGFTSPRGHSRTTPQEKRFQALYHLERVLMGEQRRSSDQVVTGTQE